MVAFDALEIQQDQEVDHSHRGWNGRVCLQRHAITSLPGCDDRVLIRISRHRFIRFLEFGPVDRIDLLKNQKI